MAFCKACGKKLDDGVEFCANCGTAVEKEGANTVDKVKDAAAKFVDTPDSTAEYSQQDINSCRGIAWLSYGGPLLLIPLFVKKESKFTRFHVNQGILLCIFYAAVLIVTSLLGLIKVTVTDPFWGIEYLATPWWINLINFLLWIPVSVFAIIGIVNAAKGKAKELPLIGKYRILK